VKIKIGESWGRNVARDLARIRQTRSRVGDHTQVYVDANRAYTRKQAIRVMERARDLDVRWFEEPVSSDDLDGLRKVRDAISADVAAGEYAWDVPYVRRMCEAEAVDCMQADATRIGGITEWLRAAAVAGSFGLEISGHCAPAPARGGGIGSAASPPGMVPRPRAHRVDVLRQGAGSTGRLAPPSRGRAGQRARLEDSGRREVSGGLMEVG
jgi:L-alanine-DL-glutamate epimerase-like enolase superfamily enzyme